MTTFEDVARIAESLPDVTVGEKFRRKTWMVGGKGFAWDRPFSKADLARFGDEKPPEGPILALRVEDLMEKEAAIAANPKSFFTIPHFDGYAAVLVLLEKVSKRVLEQAIRDAHRAVSARATKPSPKRRPRPRRRTSAK